MEIPRKTLCDRARGIVMLNPDKSSVFSSAATAALERHAVAPDCSNETLVHPDAGRKTSNRARCAGIGGKKKLEKHCDFCLTISRINRKS